MENPNHPSPSDIKKFQDIIVANSNNGNTEYTINFEGQKNQYVQIQKFDMQTLCKYNIKFVGCAFECEVNLNPNDSGTIFEYNKRLVFSNCTFKRKADCKYVKTNDKLKFIGTNFQQKMNFEHTIFCGNEYKPFNEVSFLGEVDFSNAIFEIGLDIKQSTINFNNEVRFYKTIFKNALNVDGNFKSSVDFSEAIFEKEVCFNFICEVKFDRAKFLKYVKFGENARKIKGQISMKETEFNEVDFDNIHFGNEVDFSDSKFNGKTSFNGNIFEKTPNFNNSKASDKINLSNTIFKEANFDNVKFSNVDFSNSIFEAKSNFKNAVFGEASFENVVFKKEADFSQVTFNAKSCFAEAKFESQAHFNNAIFQNSADFHSAIFQQDIYFHRAVFKQDLQMYRTIFERVANFYFATFDGVVNFSACVIQNPRFLNFVGVNTNKITIDEINDYIDEQAEYEAKLKENIEKNRNKLDLALQHAQNLKDSFRVIKDTLLSQNNLLDAQNWHRLELYAKEIEMEYILEQEQHKKTKQKKGLPKYNKQDYQKFDFDRIFILLKKSLSLLVYLICIIESLPFVALIISAYMLYNFVFFCMSKLKCIVICIKKIVKSINPLDWKKTKIFWQHYFEVYLKFRNKKIYKQQKDELDFTLWVDSAILKLYRHTSNHHTNLTTILNFTSGMIVIYAILLLLINYALPYMIDYENILSYSVATILSLFILITYLYFIDKNAFYNKLFFLFSLLVVCVFALSNMFLVSLVHILCFLMIYVVMLCIFYALFHIKNIAYYFRVFIYFSLLSIIAISPQLINPFIGIFNTDSIIDTKLESQMLKMSQNDMQILANIALKRVGTDNEKIENPREIIKQNEDILSSVYRKINTYKQDEYKKILDLLESKELSQNDKATQLKKLNHKALSILSDMLAQDFIDYTTIQTNDESTMKSIKCIMERESEAIEVLKIITNNNIKETLKAIYIDKIQKDIFKSTSILCAIILVLCLFSLQKTARKNSIIPS